MLLTLTACSTLNQSGTELEASNQADVLVDDFGIQAQSMRLTAVGRMLDFRYKVLDPAKASKVIKRTIHPYLIDERLGKKIAVKSAKIGELRHTGNNLMAGKQYFVLFANPGRQLKAGDKVTIVMGDYRLQHMQVK